MQQLVEGTDYYFNEQGYMVMTTEFLLATGYCCGNGCRHCPYNYINVPEPEHSLLIKSNEEKSKDCS